ncbi:MAG TPA: hypothetical protein VL947_11600 [Cytophagales bacterium]|nr:hypothetical protein [Cytophagales bacterium]
MATKNKVQDQKKKGSSDKSNPSEWDDSNWKEDKGHAAAMDVPEVKKGSKNNQNR